MYMSKRGSGRCQTKSADHLSPHKLKKDTLQELKMGLLCQLFHVLFFGKVTEETDVLRVCWYRKI